MKQRNVRPELCIPPFPDSVCAESCNAHAAFIGQMRELCDAATLRILQRVCDSDRIRRDVHKVLARYDPAALGELEDADKLLAYIFLLWEADELHVHNKAADVFAAWHELADTLERDSKVLDKAMKRAGMNGPCLLSLRT